MVRDYQLIDLLVQAGAQLRGPKRADCPRCGGRRTVAYTEETFFCHHGGCGWSGNVTTITRELGLVIEKPSAREISERRLVQTEAARFAEWARRKRIAAAALLRDLDRHEATWREVGQQELVAGKPISERVWKKLELCARWQERAEFQWRRLLNFESNAGELYREFSRERETA